MQKELVSIDDKLDELKKEYEAIKSGKIIPLKKIWHFILWNLLICFSVLFVK